MRVVCAYCVQWRCKKCKSDDWPNCCDWETDSEPYWPDGSIATLTQNEPCASCAEAIEQYYADQRRFLH